MYDKYLTCKPGYILRFLWYKNKTEASKDAYKKHRANCPECHSLIEPARITEEQDKALDSEKGVEW